MSSSRSPRPLPRSPPLSSTETDYGKGRGVGTSCTTRPSSGTSHPPPQAAGAQHFAMDAGEYVGEAPAAGRPAPLLEVLPQERVQQRTAEQIVDPVRVVPLLHAFVPQMVEQLVDFLAPLDFRVAEQVIEVPKIVCPPRAARTVLRAPQTADQLVEVPTIVLLFFVDAADYGAEQLPFQFVVVEGETSIFKVFFPDRVQPRRVFFWNAFLSRLWSRSLTFLFLLEAFKHFRPGQSSSSVAHSPAAWLNLEDEPFQGGFRTFSPEKSATDHCSTLIRWSSYCTCKAVGDSRAPTVAALTRSLTCPFCSTTARGSTCRKLQWSRSCCAFFWWPTSLLCRSCWCRFLRLWTPCAHAATSFFSSTVEVLRFVHRQSHGHLVVQQRRALDFRRAGYDGNEGFFGAFCAIFRAPPVIPELSASFSSFRVLTTVSARGLQRVCQFMTTVLWIYTHL